MLKNCQVQLYLTQGKSIFEGSMNINEAIKKLSALITERESEGKTQGLKFYKSAMLTLQNGKADDANIENLYRSFCGYLAHGEFSNSEYEDIKELVSLIKKT